MKSGLLHICEEGLRNQSLKSLVHSEVEYCDGKHFSLGPIFPIN